MTAIRRCRTDEHGSILAIINAAAEAYRGVVPAEFWHEPYLTASQLESEIAAGVEFWGCEVKGALVGVMGLQAVRDVDLIRHAYVLPTHQHLGIGSHLLTHLRALTTRQMLVGTWAAAVWAIRFYQRHGYALVAPERQAAVLRKYWTISDRQLEMSVVLANPPIGADS